MNVIRSEAPNLDGETREALWEIWCRVYRRPVVVAREWFPDRPRGYVMAARDLGNYACNKAVAMRLRARGDIQGATLYEKICEGIYQRLPIWARW